MEECINIILKMRPQVEVRHLFVGSIAHDVRERLRGLTQGRRDEIFQTMLATKFKDLFASGRLGLERFTLVGGTELGEAVKSRKEQLEGQINEVLKGVIE